MVNFSALFLYVKAFRKWMYNNSEHVQTNYLIMLVLEGGSFVIFKGEPLVLSGRFLGNMDDSFLDFTRMEFRK